MMRGRACARAAATAATLALALATSATAGAPPMRRLPAPEAAGRPPRSGPAAAMFGGGCFWGAQAVFAHLKGVRSAVSGYAGDATDYRTASSGVTDSVEAVTVTYDPAVIGYDQLLQVFLSVVVDPTEAGGQVPDRGPQYQATIFFETAEQKRAAHAYLEQLGAAHVFDRRIAVDVRPDHGFHEAEPMHQDYVRRHPELPYVKAYDAPRLAGLKQVFPELYADQG